MITGAIVILFGLHFLGVFRWNIFRGMKAARPKEMHFFSSALFGMVFSVGWTPCVGAFLGSALTMASREGEVLRGILMLLAYSAGLGIPFIISAVLIDKLKSTFDFIKKHYRVINTVSGVLLVLVGVLMMTGLFGAWIAWLSQEVV